MYLGVAEAARDAAVAAVAGTAKADDPSVQRQIGLMDHRLRVAVPGRSTARSRPSATTRRRRWRRVAAVMAAKREIALAGIEVCDLAMEVAGGAAFFRSGRRSSGAYRDIRGAKFHPFTPEQTLHPRRPTGARPGRLRDLTAEPTTPCGPR